MAVKAYIMLDIDAGKISSVVDELAKIKNIKKAYPITGDYDAIAEIEVEETGEVGDLVTNKIQNLKGVRDTTTHIAFR